MADGLLNMLKPPGMTSHDVVDGVRRIVGTRRVGHTGTLDPAAAGVMVLMIGAATRLSEFLTARPKVYRAEITFGIATDTLDGEGTIVERADARALRAAPVREALAALTGELQIVPPMYSAVWHHGRRLYDIARSGETVEVETRTSVIDRFELLDFQPGSPARALTEIACSSGTYVRSLAAMAGAIVGLPAYLSLLVRTRVGPLEIADALTGRELTQVVRDGRLSEVLIAPEDALTDWPRLVADAPTARALSNGMRVPPWQPVGAGHLLVMREDGRLLCVAEALEIEGTLMVQPRRLVTSEDVPRS